MSMLSAHMPLQVSRFLKFQMTILALVAPLTMNSEMHVQITLVSEQEQAFWALVCSYLSRHVFLLMFSQCVFSLK